MAHAADWLRRLNPPRRNTFFAGKMMGVAQFEREQRYGMGQRWLMNRLTLGTGILCGLEVRAIEGKRLRVEAGVAVDPLGREIVVARPVEYDPFTTDAGFGCGQPFGVSQAGNYVLCLAYRECTADDLPATYADECSGLPDCQPDTTVESYSLCLREVASVPVRFDCGAWTRPLDATVAPPAAPGAAAAPAETTPPSIAVLRERLARQFVTSCGAPPGDGCVVLGLVTVSKDADGNLTASLPPDFGQPRVQIYSQSQLLDVILCLAQCCAGGHGEPTPPGGTLRVEKVEVVGLDLSVTPPRFVALERAAGSHPPLFSPGSSEPGSVPVALRVTFNRAIDASSIPDPIAGSAAKSVRLVRAAQPQDVELLPVALTEQPNVLIVAGLASAGLQVGPSFGPVGGPMGGLMRPWGPGVYTLTLHGHAGGGHDAITSWPPESAQSLDGDWGDTDTFPEPGAPGTSSGDGTAGGDFVVRFEIGDTLRLIGIATNQADVTTTVEPVPLQWSKAGIELTLLFNRAVDEKTVAKGVTVTLPDGSSPRPREVTSGLDGTRAVVTFPAGRNGFPQPGVSDPYAVNVTLSGSAGGLLEPQAAGGAPFDGDRPAHDALPTGDGVAGGDFTFALKITR